MSLKTASEATFLDGLAAALAPALLAVAAEAARLAEHRAAEISRMSAGAVQPTAEQCAAIRAAEADLLFTELSSSLVDVARVFTLNITPESHTA